MHRSRRNLVWKSTPSVQPRMRNLTVIGKGSWHRSLLIQNFGKIFFLLRGDDSIYRSPWNLVWWSTPVVHFVRQIWPWRVKEINIEAIKIHSLVKFAVSRSAGTTSCTDHRVKFGYRFTVVCQISSRSAKVSVQKPRMFKNQIWCFGLQAWHYRGKIWCEKAHHRFILPCQISRWSV